MALLELEMWYQSDRGSVVAEQSLQGREERGEERLVDADSDDRCRHDWAVL